MKVPAGCRGNTNQFAFDGDVSVMVQDDMSSPHYQVAFNLTSFLGFRSNPDSDLTKILYEIQMMGHPEGMKIKDISKRLLQRHHTGIRRF